MELKDQFVDFIHALQDEICRAIETLDGKARFREDVWSRADGGGGKTRIIQDGAVFEKGGVNTSVVFGEAPAAMKRQFQIEGSRFFACGISLVLHPFSPMAPTVHANYRYFELYDESGAKTDCWFGGGADLTPYYLWEVDAVHFHQTHKNACDAVNTDFYPQFKRQCDEYFRNAHRDNEARGVGGIFYDYMRPGPSMPAENLLALATSCGQAFLTAYLPIVEKRRDEPFTPENKAWQGIRRGRYVEFNLIHDRGTLFGLRTNGRIESILMSLPPEARWEYDFHPEPGSREAALLEYLKPRDWVIEKVNSYSSYSC